MAKRQRSDISYPASLVWAAACAAYRVNAGYHKYPDIQDGKIVRPTNRDLVRLYLADETRQFITDSDIRQGELCRQTLANQATMAALKGELAEWGRLSHEMTELEVVETEYQLSVITAMPRSYDQTLAREDLENRLAHCDAGIIGKINDRVTLSGEIVRVSYSNRFNTYYTTVITDTNQEVFFAYRERLATTRRIRFCGRVKRHAGRATQLSRVKLVEQEVV